MCWVRGIQGRFHIASRLVELTVNTHVLRLSMITSALHTTLQNKELNKDLFISIFTIIFQLLCDSLFICITIKLVLSTYYMPSI